jgi:hypothetical protein
MVRMTKFTNTGDSTKKSTDKDDFQVISDRLYNHLFDILKSGTLEPFKKLVIEKDLETYRSLRDPK